MFIIVVCFVTQARILFYLPGKGEYTYDVHENCLIFKSLHPCSSKSKIFPPPWPWTSTFNEPTPAPSPPTVSNKLWHKNRTGHVNKRNQNKNKTKLDDVWSWRKSIFPLIKKIRLDVQNTCYPISLVPLFGNQMRIKLLKGFWHFKLITNAICTRSWNWLPL